MSVTRLLAHKDTLNEETVHLMPFHIAFDGSADMSQFVRLPPIQIESDSYPTATFRGRLMLSTTLQLPPDYTGLIVRVKTDDSIKNLALRHDAHAEMRAQQLNLKRKRAEARAADQNEGHSSGLRRSPRKLAAVARQLVNRTARARPQKKQKFSLDSPPSSPVQAMDPVHVAEGQDVKEEAGEEVTTQDEGNVTAPEQDQTMSNSKDPEDPEQESKEEGASVPEQTAAASMPESPSKPTQVVFDFIDSEDANVDQTGQDPTTIPIDLTPVSTFDHISVWNPDGPLDEGGDVFWRTLNEFTALAQLASIFSHVASDTSAHVLTLDSLLIAKEKLEMIGWNT